MALADVGGDVEEFLLAGVVVVDEFPVALADGAAKVNAGAEVAPHVGEVPHEGTVLFGMTAAQEGREGLAVDGLRRVGDSDVRHVEERGIEVLYHHVVRGLARGRLRDAGPAHDEGHTDAALAHGTLAARERGVLREEGAGAPFVLGGETAVVAHEKYDGVVRLVVAVEPVKEVAEALVHTLHKGGVGRLARVETLGDVLGIETRIAVDGHVYGIVGHIEEEGLAGVALAVEGGEGLKGESLGGEGAGAPVLLKAGDGVEGVGRAVGVVAVVLLA